MHLNADTADSRVKAALAYCQAWIARDKAALLMLLNPDIIVVECYGPEYHGTDEVRAWFEGWHAKGGRVLSWDVKEAGAFRQGVCLKWRFACRWEGRESCFDGVSLMDFDDRGRIVRVEEYSAKAEHTRPYGKEEKGDV